MSASEDQNDAGRVLAGDVEAFEGIVRRWERPLVNLAYRFCRDRDRSEDMAQEAFLRAFRALHTWRRDGVFSTWLFAIATNAYRTEIRRIPAHSVPLDEFGDTVSAGTSDARHEEELHNEVVRRAVSNLPPKYSEALILFYFHDMNVSEAARTLNTAEGTIKARLFRARELLRERLPRLLREPRG